jgi:hypothetical protein
MSAEILNEGAPVHIDWHLLTPGASFFIPAIQVTQLAREVRNAAVKRDIRLIHRICVYNNMYGIRFWREP